MNSLLWILRTAITILVILFLTTALAWGGYLAVAELQRSMTSLATRIDAAESRINLLRSDVNTLVEGNPDSVQQSEITNLQQQVTNLENRVATWQTDLTADLAHQQELLTGLQTGLTAVLSDTTTHTTQITNLQEISIELEQELEGVNGRLDDLRHDTTGLQTTVTGLQETAITQEDLTAEIQETQQTLTLFRVWQLIARARLRLVEANVGLATADVELALRTMDSLVAAYPDTTNEPWQLVQARLG